MASFIDMISEFVGTIHVIKAFNKIQRRMINHHLQKQCQTVYCSEIITAWFSNNETLMLQRHNFKFLRIPLPNNNMISYPVKISNSNFRPLSFITPTYKIIENQIQRRF